MDKIDIPKELSERSKMGVSQAKKEMERDRKSFNIKGIGIAALLMSVGLFIFLNNGSQDSADILVVNEDGSVEIPALQLPQDTSSLSMIGLIVYNGKIYTQTGTDIKLKDAKKLLGEKLGKTKGNIDEWSKQEAYDNEFASSISEIDVYAVKGYDKNFRIMTYDEERIVEEPYFTFYENLNGITITSGEDVFGELKMVGNVSSAKYRRFSDWDYAIENYHFIEEMDAVNNFVQKLNEAKPFPRQENSDPMGNSRNNENFKELIIRLNDGSQVSLKLLKGGYIYYGIMDVYFQMNEDGFSKMWSQLE